MNTSIIPKLAKKPIMATETKRKNCFPEDDLDSGKTKYFVITKYLVFPESRSSSGKQFFRFVSVAIIGFFANLGMIDVFIHYFNMYPPLARPLAMLSLFFASFFIHKFFSFSLALRHQHAGADNK